MILAIAISSGMMSCSTNAVEDEPTPVNPESETRTLNIRVVSNDFTRAGEKVADDAIQTLYLAFYKEGDNTPIYIKEANGSDYNYTVEIPAKMVDNLDKVIAFANITDKKIISEPLTGSTIGKVQNDDDGSLIMSSSIYFNEGNSSLPIYYSPIVKNNTIVITLDRVASKVTVKNSITQDISVPNVDKYSDFSMAIESWGVTLTDKESYLIKQLPENYLLTKNELRTKIKDLLGVEYANWENQKNISWANSVNFNKFTESDFSESNIAKINLSQANKAFGSSIFVHESTRSKTDLGIANSKPSIVIVGQFKRGTKNMETFYRLRSDNKDGKDYIYTTEEYFNYLYDNQNFLYINEEGSVKKADVENLQKLLVLSTPSENVAGTIIPDFFVSPQVKESESTTFCDISGTSYEVEDLNGLLYAHAGLLEMYLNGQCIFIEPIKHYQYGNDIVYGMIRNHSYTLNIQNITGFGRGVSSSENPIKDEVYSDFPKSYQINSSLTVNTWNEPEEEQIVDIDNSKK